MTPGTTPEGHPEHVKAPSAASGPLAGAPYPKTSIFLKEIIDFRCRVGPSRPRISALFEHLGMPSPLSPNLFFRTCLFELCFFRTSPLTPTPRPSRGRRTEWACAHCRRPRRTELFATGVTTADTVGAEARMGKAISSSRTGRGGATPATSGRGPASSIAVSSPAREDARVVVVVVQMLLHQVHK